MKNFLSPEISPKMQTALAKALAQPAQRVRPLRAGAGAKAWLKRVEYPKGLMRLQKGDGAKAFVAERDALLGLRGRNLPVAEPLAAGDDYLLLPDVGPTLAMLMASKKTGEAERLRAFTAAGQALAELHQAGLAHGRPALRDMCWDGTRVRLIDFERFRDTPRSARARAMDLVIFVHTWFARVKGQTRGPELDAAWDSYFAHAPADIRPQVQRLLRLLQPARWLARFVLSIKPRARDWLAVDGTLAYIRERVAE